MLPDHLHLTRDVSCPVKTCQLCIYTRAIHRDEGRKCTHTTGDPYKTSPCSSLLKVFESKNTFQRLKSHSVYNQHFWNFLTFHAMTTHNAPVPFLTRKHECLLAKKDVKTPHDTIPLQAPQLRTYWLQSKVKHRLWLNNADVFPWASSDEVIDHWTNNNWNVNLLSVRATTLAMTQHCSLSSSTAQTLPSANYLP